MENDKVKQFIGEMLDIGAAFDQSASEEERDTVRKEAESLYNSHIEDMLEDNKPVNRCAIWLTPELVSYFENKWQQSTWPFKEDVANMIIAEGKKNNQELSKNDAFNIFFKYCKQTKCDYFSNAVNKKQKKQA